MVFWCLESEIRVMLLYALVDYVESFRSLKKRKGEGKVGVFSFSLGLRFHLQFLVSFGAKIQRSSWLRLCT